MGSCHSEQKKDAGKPKVPAATKQQPAPVEEPAAANRAKPPEPPPAPKTPRRQETKDATPRQKSDNPQVLAYFAGAWYVAEVLKESNDAVDVLWEDDTFTKDLPKDQTYALEVGADIEARWGGDWYPCKVLQLHPSLDVKWKDSTISHDLATSSLRPPTSPLLDSAKMIDPLTPVRTGIFGRRPVLMPGSDVEIKGQDGYWYPGVVHQVGDACEVEYASGERSTVPLSDVRTPLDNLNYDLA